MEKTATKKDKKAKNYFEEVGRRKTSVARARLFKQKAGERAFLVNNKPFDEYFPTKKLQQRVLAPLELLGYSGEFKVSARVNGGGASSQADAVRHGIARALVLFDPESRKKLKKASCLKRDPRMRERKKFGLKRARRAPQWQKR